MFPHIAHHIRRETLRSHPSFDSSIFPSQLDFPVLDSSSFGNPFESGIWKPDWISPISASAVVDLHLPSLPYSLPEAYNLAANRGFDPPAPPPLQIVSQMHIPTCGPGENRRLSLSLASNPSPSDIQAAGPLGPFTGYAAILKTSRFLKPAQQLLDEFCGFVTGSSIRKDSDSRPSFQKDDFGFQGSAGEARRPEFQQTKAKLLYMQEQVCRRYKQYQQQMQMVVSSFECVAGLSSATPYAALALRTVSKHFRCLKGVISDQLRRICSVLGDEPMPVTAKAESSAGDASSLRRSHHPVWRPQRGLPERAVSVLRAWLFDHFLHPYPTDTDKHMLASQTGLSRNQVSNWFINARVRMWKPMVEEIHMLETKDAPGMDLNASEVQLGEAAAEVSACFGRKWHGDKRPRVEDCGADAGMMNFTCPPGIGIGIGGLDAVSLTLGLRQGEGIQQEGQIRHFGHHMLHDFVG